MAMRLDAFKLEGSPENPYLTHHIDGYGLTFGKVLVATVDYGLASFCMRCSSSVNFLRAGIPLIEY